MTYIVRIFIPTVVMIASVSACALNRNTSENVTLSSTYTEPGASPTATPSIEDVNNDRISTNTPKPDDDDVPLTFVIAQDESEARFIIDEVLSGSPKTVVGTTNAVEGSINVSQFAPLKVTLGVVRVDLSTLKTDNSFRNRAIQDFILEVNEPGFQYAVFEAHHFEGLPESVSFGIPYEFQIIGNLTIHGVTKEETFFVKAVLVSETRIEGTATLSNIAYADYGIRILRLPPQVASVGESVTLELSFVAVAP